MTSPVSHRCRVCGGSTRFVFEQGLLGRPVRYFDCATCGHFQTETPFWLEEAYAAAINDVDTGILVRNLVNQRRVIMTLQAFGRLRGSVVDHAGGYGVLVRLLRDAGVDARWRDKYCQNLVARGFEATDSPCDLMTAFEVFEHLEAPLDELALMLGQSPVVLLSTELVPGAAAPDPSWWYLGPEHGQHIGFFRASTLAWMAQKLGCHHATDGQRLHVFARRPIPRRWIPMMRMNRLAPLVAWTGLRSKTIDDFNLLRGDR